MGRGTAGGDVVAIVSDIAARAHVSAPSVRVRRTANVAYVRRSLAGNALVLDPSVLGAEPDVLRSIVAHEIGHVAAGHQVDIRLRLWATVGVSVLSGVVVLALTGYALAAACAVLVPSTLFSLGVLRRLRRHELAADAFAVALLGEGDSTLAALAWLDRVHPRGGRRGPWALGFLDDHPSRAERVAAVRADSPMSG